MRGNPCVYFIAEDARAGGDCGFVKIGWCIDVTKRLEQVQLGNPRKVKLLGCVDGGREMEPHFHTRFAAYRARGEWFRLCGELAEFVRGLSS